MKKCNQKGSTLIECLISMVLLAIILMGGMSLYFNADAWLTMAMHKKIATEIVSSKMEDLKRLGYSSLPAPADPPVVFEQSDIIIGSLQAKTEDSLGLTVTVTDIDEIGSAFGPDYKQVDIVLAWLEASNQSERSVSLTTLIAP